MKYKIEELELKIKEALNNLGYLVDNVVINSSNRPDLGDYQYNGIMALTKKYHKNPIDIANELLNVIKDFPELK